jgi:hypothetical protein
LITLYEKLTSYQIGSDTILAHSQIILLYCEKIILNYISGHFTNCDMHVILANKMMISSLRWSNIDILDGCMSWCWCLSNDVLFYFYILRLVWSLASSSWFTFVCLSGSFILYREEGIKEPCIYIMHLKYSYLGDDTYAWQWWLVK